MSTITPSSAATIAPDAAPTRGTSEKSDTPPAVSPTAAETVVHTPRSAAASKERVFTPGSVVAGRYRIVACLGQGGMGEVYRADDLSLGQPVALKFLPEGFAENPSWMERFRNEVRTARQVAHPHVCRVHDLGEAPSPEMGAPRQFLTMEYIDGEDLASLLRRIGRLPRDKAVQVAHQLCAGLAAAHNAGILHRDLKPANIMIDGRGNAKITDFGIAGLAGSIEGHDVRSGTPAYMSPEQLAGRDVSMRSDIYSLGLVLYELFTGKRAFPGDTPTSATATRAATALSRPSSIVQDMDPAIERVIMRCLSEDPAQRPSRAMVVAAGLPGGDPLRAALEAGETPSPELVAAAGAGGRMSMPAAVGLLIGTVLVIAACFGVSRWTGLASYLPLEKSPEVLTDRAREVVRKLGAGLEVKDAASDLTLNPAQVMRVALASKAPDRWEGLRDGKPVVLRFWYRTSPTRLAPININRTVREHDPALTEAGMTMVELDSRGRLLAYQAAPPWGASEGGDAETGESSLATEGVDWSAAFALAELSPAAFRAVEPDRVPSHFADARFAWEPIEAEGANAGLRIEAASYEGRPTAFRVLGATELTGGGADPMSAATVYQYVVQAIIIAGVFITMWLARANGRAGRGDRSGAARLASGFFVLSMVTWALTTHWVGEMMTLWSALLQGVARALLLSALAWVFYMALEPFVRRRSPRLIVSWTRLVAGQVRDPLVGRDALMGVALGAVFVLLTTGVPLAHRSITGVLPPPNMFNEEILRGVTGGISATANAIVTSAINGMLIFFLFSAMDTYVPRRLGAALFALLVAGAFVSDASGTSEPLVIAYALIVGAGIAVCLRLLGMFAFGVAICVASLLLMTPLTTGFGGWNARGMWVVLVFIGALIAWAFTNAAGIGATRGRAGMGA